jgi:altered-inheritance-of-mitochondria protein 13
VQSELQRLSERETQILSEIDSKIKPGQEPDLDREKVKSQIDTLRKRLEGMPRMKELGKEVEEKRGEVVRCLQGNETRPLDCWRQVEEFKDEARRMEKRWVGGVIGREYN